MLEKNYDKKDISDITGLTIKDIKKLESQEQSWFFAFSILIFYNILI